MLLFIGKIILLYILTTIIIRLMGKSAFGQLTAHDLTGIFFAVSLALGPLFTDKLSHAIVGLIVICIVHITFSKLTLINWLNRLFIAEPTIVIKHGKLIKANLKRSHFSLKGLLSSIREKGFSDITLIDYAIIEPTGDISIIPKQEVAPVTPKQLKIEPAYQGIPIAVIIEGKIQHENLELIDKNVKWLKNELALAGFSNQKAIFYACVRDNDELLTIDTGMGLLKSNN